MQTLSICERWNGYEILGGLFGGAAGDVRGRLCGGESDGRMSKCPGCTKQCEECDNPMPVAKFDSDLKSTLLGMLEVLGNLTGRVIELE